MTAKKRSIKTRILLGVLALVGAAFVSIFVIFNISVQRYIDVNAKRQLDIAQGMMSEEAGVQGGKDNRLFKMHDQPRNPVGAQAEIFYWDGFEVVSGGAEGNNQTDAEIAAKLDIGLAVSQTQTIKTADGAYLVSAMENPQALEEYIVFYVDITDIQAFIANINMLLIIVMAVIGGAAVGVAFIMANSIAKPIQKISGFAAKIGNGVFEEEEMETKDSETDQLLTIMNNTASKLKRYDNEQKTFFQNVSHELKTPLMTIRCNAEGIEQHVMQPEQSSRLIIGEIDKLSSLIDDILYISKMDTITESEVMEELDLRELLSDCAEGHKTLAKQKGIAVEYDFSETPVLKNVAEKSMKRAFNNLISNAIRHAETKITLSCHNVNGTVVVSVENDGTSIDQKDLPHIFERFYKTEDGGHGIGLSIVKSVVDKLGGEIEVKTGEGTRFTIRL